MPRGIPRQSKFVVCDGPGCFVTFTRARLRRPAYHHPRCRMAASRARARSSRLELQDPGAAELATVQDQGPGELQEARLDEDNHADVLDDPGDRVDLGLLYRERIGPLNPLIRDILGFSASVHGEERVRAAILEASEIQASTWAGVQEILRRQQGPRSY